MKNIVNKILKPHKNKTIIASISGGVDSVVMLDILLKLNFDLVVVYFNHQQRKEAIIEAKYLEKLAEKENIKYEYRLLEVNEKENFQSAASKLRRKHLINIAKKYNTNVIVTGHHLNDLAETIILKLSRGSNLLGYAGVQQSYNKYGLFFIKPLLYVTKDEILNYAEKHNIKHYEDESNLSLTYTRNKIRHNVIPYLIADNPAFLNKIIEYNQTLSTAFNFIRKNTKNFLNNNLSFNIDKFLKLDEALKIDIVAYLLEEFDLKITTEKITMILDFISSSGPNATLNLGDNFLFIKSYNKAYIDKKVQIKAFKQKLYFDKENVLPNGGIIIFNNKNDRRINNSINLCYNNIVKPLYARTRLPGDRLYFPYGHKKLKDFYIDEKVPLLERNKDVLIVDNNNQILAVLGRYVNEHQDLKNKINLIYRRK